jgi:TPR repeat protein
MVPVMPFARWHLILYAVFILSIMLPWCWRMMSYSPEAVKAAQLERAERKRDALRELASRGDAEAQFKYANLLYTGRDGLEVNKLEACLWWERAAAQDYWPAVESLKRLVVQVP